jgi:hypothetical protein
MASLTCDDFGEMLQDAALHLEMENLAIEFSEPLSTYVSMKSL